MSFDKLSVTGRLAVGFSAVIVVMVTVFGLNMAGRKEAAAASAANIHTYQVMITGERMLAEMVNIETGARGYLVAGDEKFLAPFESGQKAFDAVWREAKALTSDNPAQQDRLEQIHDSEQAFVAKLAQTIEQRRAVAGGTQSMDDVVATFGKAESKKMMDAARTRIGAFSDAEKTLLGERTARAKHLNWLGDMLSIFGSLIAVAAAVAMGLWIRRSLMRQLGGEPSYAAEVVRRIGAGTLDQDVRVSGTGPSLLADMRRLQQQLRDFSVAQTEIGERHDAGEIDYRIDASAFPGAYGRMAQSVNDLVASHIAVKMHVVDVVGAYARGDLSRDVNRYPGQKARITEAVDAVKSGMTAVNTEIKALVDAAAAGDFGVRGDAARFDFVYRELIEGLNALMATADSGLGEIGALLGAVADGDLGRRIERAMPGQFGQLADDANRTIGQLTEIVGQIRHGSEAINAAAVEIAAGNADLSSRTEQQAASLEETASSMEELTGTVRQNAESARQANQLAQGAAEVATMGGGVVGQVVRTMGEIQESSRRIAEIISVIDGIAFQTNILALNAAVEAARAGEQGRGFAVVASEVRSLAQRSAGAAKEIKQLITDSVDRVEQGATLVDEAGRTMGEIVTSVKRVTDIIADITAASAEQSAGIEQVNQAITHMDEGTQQNAALVEEASASARSLEQQAEQLVQAVAVFRLDGRTATAAPAKKASATAPAPRPTAPRVRAMAPAPRVRTLAPADATDAGSHWQEF